ncbi:MAG: energy-coupling factor transporter ATPase [Deltaproteobacteria bacterium HGW-Deltaproteobacteria-19]|jgi:biotin transport system ATP-binding protein/energy-coupling factor transport system ATP-binding protein|nr:MAG: energy-coupling factor transporter ATPase [Deltaproteobacteria bacterium HGW-Deltaproteobacteria-19]
MIVLDGVSFRYGEDGPDVLRGVDLRLREGEYVALAGHNGCGKSTLLKHLNALLVPTEGTVTVDGLDTRDSSLQRGIRRAVGMVFQNPDHQIVGMTVEEDVAFGPGNLALPPREVRECVREALARVGLEGYESRAPHTLSGGEKRLVSIAGVLAMKPRFIALDEPTAYLDPVSRRRVLDLIVGLHRQGMGILHVTHSIGNIVDADRLVVMERGSIALDDRPEAACAALASGRFPGLEAPPVATLMAELKSLGWGVNPNVLSIREACREIDACLARRPGERP